MKNMPPAEADPQLDMRLVKGGDFAMGSNDFYHDERPVRSARVSDFWIDVAPVTNAQFATFVAATGHVTLAETAPDPRDYPGMPAELAVAASIVFYMPDGPVDTAGPPSWWRMVPGAHWRVPNGSGSDIAALMEHPVVHIAAGDAEAYAAWAGKSLPTEAEWEFAARGGLDGAPYAWGEEFQPGGKRMAKTWDGEFPYDNRADPGLERTAAVGSYLPNGYGLYDMIGNVWEWTADVYSATPGDASPSCCSPKRAGADIEQRVLKGGSHLCAPNYCRRYRPAARWPQPVDTSTSHVGFRCIIRC